MHLDEVKAENKACSSQTNFERADAVRKMFQDSIEPCKTAVYKSVSEACEKPGETALAALGIATTAAALVLASRVPGATGQVLSGISNAFCLGGGLLYAKDAGEVFSPAVDTWIHPENLSKNAEQLGNGAGRLVYETGFAAMAGGLGAHSVKGVNGKSFSSFLGIGKSPALLAIENAEALPAVENKSFEDLLVKKKYAVAEVPPTTELTGRVFPPHTTDHYAAREGDIRIGFAKNGNGYKAYTEVRTAKSQWVNIDLFDKNLANLYYASDQKAVIQKSDQLIKWLHTYKGKVVQVGHNNDWNCAQYKLIDSHRPTADRLKVVATQVGAEKLPVHLDYTGNVQFGVKPRREAVEDGAVWFKRLEGERGKLLVGDWEPHLRVCGQWIKCKIDPRALKPELLHFESKPESLDNCPLISDAMQRGKFSFELLIRDTNANARLQYLLRKH